MPAPCDAYAPQPIRVLAVLGSINPNTGGPPNTAKYMWIAESRAGVRLCAAVCSCTPPLPVERNALAHLERQGIEIEPCGFSGPARLAARWGISVPLALSLFRLVRAADVVQVHGSWLFSAVTAALAAKLARRRLVLVPHESLTRFDIEQNRNLLLRIAKRIIKPWLLRAADAVVFSSDMESRDSLGARHSEKGIVIYHPAFDERAPPYQPRAERPAGTPLRVGFLGRFHGKKNLDLLIDAVAGLHEVILVVAGDGPADYRDALRAHVERLGIAERVQWLGFVSSDRMDEFFASIDVLAMPSEYECFGRSAAEAMVHGLPTIVSGMCGIAEVIRRHDCGIIVPPELSALREAIVRLHAAPVLRADFSRRAIAATEAELSLKSFGGAVTRLYRELLRHEAFAEGSASASMRR